MVKASLTGKKQTTTQALGAGVARWIMQAGCGVMVLIGGELVACTLATVVGTGESVVCPVGSHKAHHLKECRIYRDTVRQIKSLIGLA